MDDQTLKELKKIVSFCRKNGVTSLKMDGIEIALSQTALFPESEYKRKKASKAAPGALSSDFIPTEPQYTDEDILLWSSAGLPDEKETT